MGAQDVPSKPRKIVTLSQMSNEWCNDRTIVRLTRKIYEEEGARERNERRDEERQGATESRPSGDDGKTKKELRVLRGSGESVRE